MKNYVTPVFDRRKKVESTGYGKVELLICISTSLKKYIGLKFCNQLEWQAYHHSAELKAQIKMYNEIANRMVEHETELSLDVLNSYLGIEKSKDEEKEKKEKLSSASGFIEFMKEQMDKEKLAAGTLKHKTGIIETISNFGKLCRFADLTPKNLKEFDEYLRNEPMENGKYRTDTTINNYHKVLRKYARMAYEYDFITKNPYDSPLCKFKRGVCAERKPLSEAELKRIQELEITNDKLGKARDLFIFSAYTGLAYIDAQAFDFEKMTEKLGDTYYIDGARVKTGESFFTPILPPAMEVLKKYDYKLPRLSNQKLNDYLHVIEAEAKISKKMTSHVARHSFATLVLAHDVPIEKVAKMLGHAEIKTTQIYAKVRKESIEKHTQSLLASFRPKAKAGRRKHTA